MNKYLFDTNFFLDSSLRYYQHSFFNDFWKWLKCLSENDEYKSISRVREELRKKEDFVSDFINELSKKFFIDDKKYLNAYQKVIQHSREMHVKDSAKDKFAEEHRADAWLIAVALKDKYTIVSNEKILDIKERIAIKIPRVCYDLNIRCIDIFDFIKEQKVEFNIKNILQTTGHLDI